MKKLLRLALPVLLLVVMTGCGPKEFDLSQPLLLAEGQPVSDLSLITGVPIAFQLALPEGADIAAVVEDDAVVCTRGSDGLTLIGVEAGDHTLTLTLTGEGYQEAQIAYPVNVLYPQGDLALLDEDGMPVDSLTLSYGETRTLSISADEGVDFSLDNSDYTVADTQLDRTMLEVRGAAPGDANLELTARRAGYADAALTLPVTVEKASPGLTVSPAALTVTQGESAAAVLSFPSDAEHALTWDADRLTVTEEAGRLTITPKTAGTHTIAIRCWGDGYREESAFLTVTAVEPAVSLAPLSPISLTAGESRTFSLTADPADAVLSAVSGNDAVTVSLQGDQLTVTGAYVGSGMVTIRADAPGHSTAEQTVTVTVQAKQAAASPHADVADEIIRRTNAERTAASLAALSHDTAMDAPALKRAGEASRYWSHTRPDGTNFDTVFEEYGLASPAYYGRGENLFNANVLDARLVVDGWMDSPGHRENILRPDYTHISVAIIQGEDGSYYYAQLFSHSK